MGTKVDFFWLESIELVELDLEPVLESSEIVHRRIGPGFSVIFGWFGWFWAILGVKMETKVDFFWLESIELVEVYLESRWNHLEQFTGESAQVLLWFLGDLGGFGWFWDGRGGPIWNLRTGIDRPRRVLSGITLESSGTVHRRIGPGFTKNWTFFGPFFAVFWGFRGEGREFLKFFFSNR
jgi:hypothetical protein